MLNHVACVVATHDPFLLGSTEFALHYHLVLFLSFFFLFSLPPFQWKFVFIVDFFLASRRTLRFHAAVCTNHVACCVPSVHVHPIQSESFGSLLLIFLAKAFLYIFGLDIEIPLIAFYVVIEIKYTSSTSLDVAETQTQCTWPAPASLATRAMVNG